MEGFLFILEGQTIGNKPGKWGFIPVCEVTQTMDPYKAFYLLNGFPSFTKWLPDFPSLIYACSSSPTPAEWKGEDLAKAI